MQRTGTLLLVLFGLASVQGALFNANSGFDLLTATIDGNAPMRVCGDSMSDSLGLAMCSEMGYDSFISFTPVQLPFFDPGLSFDCTTVPESNLLANCQFSVRGCNFGVALRCGTIPEYGVSLIDPTTLELVENTGVDTGIIAVHSYGDRGTVCDDSITFEKAQRLCEQLGYFAVSSFGFVGQVSGSEPLSTWVDELQCQSSDFRQCTFTKQHDCNSLENLRLTCSGSPVRYSRVLFHFESFDSSAFPLARGRLLLQLKSLFSHGSKIAKGTVDLQRSKQSQFALNLVVEASFADELLSVDGAALASALSPNVQFLSKEIQGNGAGGGQKTPALAIGLGVLGATVAIILAWMIIKRQKRSNQAARVPPTTPRAVTAQTTSPRVRVPTTPVAQVTTPRLVITPKNPAVTAPTPSVAKPTAATQATASSASSAFYLPADPPLKTVSAVYKPGQSQDESDPPGYDAEDSFRFDSVEDSSADLVKQAWQSSVTDPSVIAPLKMGEVPEFDVPVAIARNPGVNTPKKLITTPRSSRTAVMWEFAGGSWNQNTGGFSTLRQSANDFGQISRDDPFPQLAGADVEGFASLGRIPLYSSTTDGAFSTFLDSSMDQFSVMAQPKVKHLLKMDHISSNFDASVVGSFASLEPTSPFSTKFESSAISSFSTMEQSKPLSSDLDPTLFAPFDGSTSLLTTQSDFALGASSDNKV